MDKEQLEREQWKEEKRKKKARFTAMQNLPYEVKVKRAELRVIERWKKQKYIVMDTNRVLKICMHIYVGVKCLKRTVENENRTYRC